MTKTDTDREIEQLERHLNKIAPGIGYLVMAFNSLEHLLDTVIIEFISDDIEEIGRAVIEGVKFQAKVNLLDRLYGPLLKCIGRDALFTMFEKLKGDLRRAADHRNDVVHAAWLEYDTARGCVPTRRKSTREGVQVVEKQITPREIERRRRFVERVEERLMRFDESRHTWKPANQRSHPTRVPGRHPRG